MRDDVIYHNMSLKDYENIMKAVNYHDCLTFVSEGVLMDNALIYNLGVTVNQGQPRKYIIFQSVAVNTQQSKLVMTLTDDDRKALDFIVKYEHAFV